MLSNAYFLAKFRFDTAENEPAKNFCKFCKHFANLPISLSLPFAKAVDQLLAAGASAQKAVVNPQLEESRSSLSLAAFYGRIGADPAGAARIFAKLQGAGASSVDADLKKDTIYHHLCRDADDVPVLDRVERFDRRGTEPIRTIRTIRILSK